MCLRVHDSDRSFDSVARSHAHVGTVSGVRAKRMDGTTGAVKEELCDSKPIYGQQKSVDDSFLIGMGVCNGRKLLERGDILHVSSVYNARAQPYIVENLGATYDVSYAAPYSGVMAYYTVFYTFNDGIYSEFVDVPRDVGALADDAAAAADAQNEGSVAKPASCGSPLEKSPSSFVDIRASIDARRVDLPISPDADGSLALFWERSGLEDGRVVFGVEYTFVEEPPSWIGVGVGSRGMVEADIIVVDFDMETDAVELKQYWSTTYGTPTLKSDLPSAEPYALGSCGVVDTQGETEVWIMGAMVEMPATSTRYVQFSRPLESSGEFGNSLVAGANSMIFAMGFDVPGVEIFDYHGMNRGRFEIDIPEEILVAAN